MAEEREELVGGSHPKKNKPGACCLLLVAWRFTWRPRNLATSESAVATLGACKAPPIPLTA